MIDPHGGARSLTTPLDFAISQIGIVEQRGNRGVPYARYALTGEDPLPWCARGVRWCFTQAGIRLPGNRYLIGRVQTMREELTALGALLPSSAAPEPGDLLFLRDRGDSDVGSGQHVAIVESCGNLTVNTVDFNWGDKVQRVARDRHSPAIKCFARWPIKATA